MKRFARASVSLIFLVTLLLSSGLAQEETDKPLRQFEDAVLKLFDRVSDSVVAIHCSAKVEKAVPVRRPRVPRMPQGEPEQAGGYFGTGVIFSPDGYILTSTTVVPEDGKDIKVTLHSGKEFPAKLVGSEKRNNVTLIKIDGEKLPHARLGNSSSVRVGQLSFTVSNPYDSIKNDCQPAFSMGIVSGIYRLRGDGDYTGQVIETDAALNAGSDGGPLFDSKGEVIGILNLSYSYSRWLGTAVPIDQIKFILEDLNANKEINPRYGFTRGDEVSRGGGAVVQKVAKNGPAAKAGLRPGDIILEVDGVKIRKPDELARELTLLPPGSRVSMLVRRDLQELVIQILLDKTVKEREKVPEVSEPAASEPPEQESRAPGFLGVVAAEIDLTPDKPGVPVGLVRAGSPAEKAGVRAGDRILQINEKPVNTVEQVKEILKDLRPGDKLKLLIQRGNQKREFEVTLATKPQE
jgi:serine protease Do